MRLNGHIVLAQEGRFLLEDERGGKRLFVLSNKSRLGPEQLLALAQSGVKVTVRYSEPEHVVAGLAHTIEVADPDQGRAILRGGIVGTIRDFLANWSLPRQLAGESGRTTAAASAMSRQLRPRLLDADRIGTSICCYCAVGCAQLVYARNGKVIHVEGDPRSPINQGTLCPKGAATLDLLSSPLRLNEVLHRAPGSDLETPITPPPSTPIRSIR